MSETFDKLQMSKRLMFLQGGILEKFQRHSALPNVKYNYALLFWS